MPNRIVRAERIARYGPQAKHFGAPLASLEAGIGGRCAVAPVSF